MQGVNKVLGIILVLSFIIIMVLSNPDISDYAQWKVKQLQVEDRPITNFLSSSLGKPFIENTTVRQNYLIFSLFEYEETRTIGVLGQFVTITGK